MLRYTMHSLQSMKDKKELSFTFHKFDKISNLILIYNFLKEWYYIFIVGKGADTQSMDNF